MQFSESWLRTFVDPDLSTEALAHTLTMAGLEVEEVRRAAPAFAGVVVAEVAAVAKHPNADRLSVCRVDAGTGRLLDIVCGAPNVRAGMRVPCALVGARLPGEGGQPFEIKAAKMRGVESQGMLCSARELGLSDDHSGLLALAADAPVGADFRALRGLDDARLVLKLTPNRADCLSVLGVAREVAALTGAPLTPVPIPGIAAAIPDVFTVRISAPQGCGRFAGRVIRNVDAAAPTPQWMVDRLEASGQRPISALVDVTNYVMLELGRPLHVYDLARLAGGIDVRFGRAGERLTLLNEQTVEVDATVLCIADDSGAIGLAGIMGGDSTKAGLDTRDIYLESAFFRPEAIAGRARRYGFASDASHRFERGVDFANNVDGIERATRLILDICGGTPGPTTDLVASLPARDPVRMRTARAAKVIGMPVSDDDAADVFDRLGFAARREPGAFVVTPPSWRFDIAIEEDLIEEVARVRGFDRIPVAPPRVAAEMRPVPETRRSAHALRTLLAAADYQEILSFGFVDAAWERDFAGNAAPIRLLNPIANQLGVMRSSLLASLVATARYNANRKAARIRLFEIGRVFLRAPDARAGELAVEGVAQPQRLAGLALGPALDEQWGEARRDVDFYDVKRDVEMLLAPRAAAFVKAEHTALHPGRSACVAIDGDTIGWIGELHPRWQEQYELPAPAVVFELELEPLLDRRMPQYVEVSKFPPVVRDRAVIVDEGVAAGDLIEAVKSFRPDLFRDVTLFDLYRGKGIEQGKKSVAFRVVMQDTDRTLTDAEADAVLAESQAVLARRFGAELRGQGEK
jgi:phenylalanyl-tRNA synthetase beta chain